MLVVADEPDDADGAGVFNEVTTEDFEPGARDDPPLQPATIASVARRAKTAVVFFIAIVPSTQPP